ncbi:MAG: hypothetical protein RBG13Loki_0709 [Promethearchaeota archaeon CR_4]|nr:MAG: hypothetical protein RBG13Loki_0709 [Candidatus Lokiarchaeota archaeon CR_4]
MKVSVITDGKYGERAYALIREKFDATWVEVPDIPPNVVLDDPIPLKIPPGDLYVSYIRHPDLILQIAELGVPMVLGITPGQGILQQAQRVNPRVVAPLTMCSLEPTTGIPAIDEFAQKFGKPVYRVTRGTEGNVEEITVVRSSPCGSSHAGAQFILHKPITTKNLQDFALAVCYECRAPRFGHTCDKKLAGTIHVQSLLGGNGDVTKCCLDVSIQNFLDQLDEVIPQKS